MSTPLLALIYWLHLVATVIWMGSLGIVIMAGWVEPSKDDYPAFVQIAMRRLQPWANISLIVLLVTGTIQMGADTHYEGLLRVRTPWAVGLLAKHIVITLILGITAVLQWGVYPSLDRARLLAQRGTVQQAQKLEAQIRRLTMINVVLGAFVLLLTAVITAVP